tara:strand:+ start:237 stop:935 length:699 start_codon:yes stop_codon:yes gene_type:complete
MKRLALLLLLFVASCLPCDVDTLSNSAPIVKVATFFTDASVISRESSVKVLVLTDRHSVGHGSGAYVVYKGKYYILTAYHVVYDMVSAMAIDGGNSYFLEKGIIHKEKDIALMEVEEIKDKKALCLKLPARVKPKIRSEVIYTGYPNLTGPLTVEGTVAGYAEDGAIILQSYAWGGASGSVVLNKRAEIIGILSGIEIGKDFRGFTVQNESIVIINPLPTNFLEAVNDAYHN